MKKYLNERQTRFFITRPGRFGKASRLAGDRRNKSIKIVATNLLLLSFVFSIGCGKTQKEFFRTPADLNRSGCVIGVEPNTAATRLAIERFPEAKIKYFSNISDAYAALRFEKVDAVVFDKPALEFAALNNPELTIMSPDLGEGHLVIGAPLKNEKLVEQVDSFIRQYRDDGTYREMHGRWLENKNPVMPTLPKTENPRGTLKIAISDTNEPFGFRGLDGKVVGFDIEFALRLARYLGMKPEIQTAGWDSLILGTQSGKYDLMIACLDGNDENRQKMLLSNDYLDSAISVLVRRDRLDVSTSETPSPVSETNAVNSETVAAAPEANLPTSAIVVNPNDSERFSAENASTKRDGRITTLSELTGKKIGVLSGSIHDAHLKQKISDFDPEYFNNYSDGVAALRSKKIAGFSSDGPTVKLIAAQYPDLAIIDEVVADDSFGFGMSLKQDKLCRELNEFLAKRKADGTLKRLDAKWVEGPPEGKIMPDYPTSGSRGTLRIAVGPDLTPFTYLSDEVILGYDIEILRLFAQEYQYKLDLKLMTFDAILASIAAEKVDLSAGGISITEERKKSILFSSPYYDGGSLVLVLGSDPKSDDGVKTTFFKRVEESFRRTLIVENRWKMILSGLVMTLVITAASAILGTIFGFFLCLIRRGKNRLAIMGVKTWIRLIQGTPMVVFLMVLYYIVFGKIDISAIFVAILAFGINMSVYFAEMLRSGIDAVDQGQEEAALALGFSRSKLFCLIVLPQAIKHIMPVYKGEIISLLKATAIVGYIAIEDLTKMSDIIRSRTYEAFFPLIITAAIYLFFAWLISVTLSRLELRVDPKRRPRRVKGIVEQNEND